MDKAQRLNALEVALNNEMNEREFYLNHARRTASPVGKAMFNQIADDELEHYERLKALHDKWVKNQAWPETVPLMVRETNVKTLLLKVVEQSKAMAETDKDDLAALEVATQFESKGVDLYNELSAASSDPREKAFFKMLAGIEREHYLSLKDTEEYLRDPGAWFALKERHGLDGG